MACVIIQRLVEAAKHDSTALAQWQSSDLNSLACGLITNAGFAAATDVDKVSQTGFASYLVGVLWCGKIVIGLPHI